MRQPDHREIHYDGVHCTLAIRQYARGVVVLKIAGSDIGEFGEAPMSALAEWLEGAPPVEFFIDARDVRGASIEVSGEWAQWLQKPRARLRTITMLTGSRFVQITAEFVRRFAGLEGVMRICTEPAVFDRALAESLQTKTQSA